jgi:N-acetylneuraminic acid mutarotase
LTGAGGVIKGKFYLAGGADYGDKANELDVYDPATNRWTAKAPMPTPRMWMSGSVLNNKLYVIGGRELATVEAYDPATNKWTTKKPMLTAREQLGVATFVTPSGNPKILAVGGWEYRKVNEMYTP